LIYALKKIFIDHKKITFCFDIDKTTLSINYSGFNKKP